MRGLLLVVPLLSCATSAPAPSAPVRPAVAAHARAPAPVAERSQPAPLVRTMHVPYIQYWLPIRQTGLIWLAMEDGQVKADMMQGAGVSSIMRQHCEGNPFFTVQQGLIGDRCVYFWLFECTTWEEWRKAQEMLHEMDRLIKEGTKLMEKEEREKREKGKR